MFMLSLSLTLEHLKEIAVFFISFFVYSVFVRVLLIVFAKKTKLHVCSLSVKLQCNEPLGRVNALCGSRHSVYLK